MSPARERATTLLKDILQFGAIPIGVNLVSAAAMVVTLAGAPRGVALAVQALALLGIVGTSSFFVSPQRPRPNGLASAVVARTLVAGSAAALSVRGGSVRWYDVAAVSLVLLATLCEAPAKKLATITFPVLVNLPGHTQRMGSRLPASAVYLLDLAALVALVAGGTALGNWPSLVLAVAATVTVAAYGLDTFALYQQRRSTEKDLTRLLSAYEPEFALHWQAPGGTAYQVEMWLPYLERLGKKFIVIVRTEVNLQDVIALTSAPVVLRRNLNDLDPVVVPSLKAVFYTNTATRNCHMVRYTQLHHIQLNHGDSDKAPSHNPVFRMYDRNFVAGQAAIDRFAANGVSMPDDAFVIVGRPQVEGVAVAERPIGEIAAPTVLYAPTWSGFYADSNYSSLRSGPTIVKALLARGCRVVFRPHPYARKSDFLKAACDEVTALLEQDAAATGRDHVFGPRAESDMTVSDCFNEADALMSDVSSVVADFLFSEKPFAMAAVATDPDTFVNEFPLAQVSYVLDARHGRAPNIDAVLDGLLSADPLAEKRRAMKTYYLGDIPAEEYAERFRTEALKYIEG